MKQLRIGLDIDEVLADFMGAYLEWFGETPSEVITNKCKTILKKNRIFWTNLRPLREPECPVTLYCTKRVNPKSYTKAWLEKHNMPKAPVYQLLDPSMNKSKYIKGRIDVFIDDSYDNVKEMNLNHVPCLLMDTPYNQDVDTPLRIYSLEYKEIESVYVKNFS